MKTICGNALSCASTNSFCFGVAYRISSGMVYQQLVHNILHDASDRKYTYQYLQRALLKDPSDPSHFIARAMAFNQDSLITRWQEIASKAPNKQGDFPWADNAKSLYEAITAIANAKFIASDELFAGLSKYIRQLSGPFFTALKSGLVTGVGFVHAKLSEQRLL